MPTDNDTRIALLEFQAKQTQDNLSNLSLDVREMKDALLKTLSKMDNRDSKDAQYEEDLKTLKVDIAKNRDFINKVIGVLTTVNFLGLPAVYLILKNAT